jgi:cytochrome c-type biogenesis protein CcmH
VVRRLASVAALTILVAAFAAVSSSAGSRASRPSMTKLEGEIMCPTCHTTLDQSDAAIATRIEVYMRRRIAEGATENQIKAELVTQFGTAILAAPPKHGFDLLAWVLPFAGLAGAAAVIALSVRRWCREDPQELAAQALDPDSEALVDAALAEFDAAPYPSLVAGTGRTLRPVAPADR